MYRSAPLRRALRHASTSARPAAKTALEDEAVLLRPLVKLYHETEAFPGQTDRELVDYIDQQLLLTSNPRVSRPSALSLSTASQLKVASAHRSVDLLASSASSEYFPFAFGAGGMREEESPTAQRWKAMADALCGTEGGGKAGYEVVRDRSSELESDRQTLVQLESGAPPSTGGTVGMKEEHDMDQSDIDGEGGEVGRPAGGGRPEGQVPKPAKSKSPGEKDVVDDTASSLDGEGFGVGRTSGGGKDPHGSDPPKPAKIKGRREKNAADDDASSLDGEGAEVGRVTGGGKGGY